MSLPVPRRPFGCRVRTRLRGFHAAVFCSLTVEVIEHILSQTSAPLQGLTHTAPRTLTLVPFMLPLPNRSTRDLLSRLALRAALLRPLLPRFGTLQRFPIRSEPPIPPTVPNRRVKLRPQSFALSRRFAPAMNCRAYFVPVPLLGFPFEAFLHRQRRILFRVPRPSGLTLCTPLSPFGREHQRVASLVQGLCTLPAAFVRTRVFHRAIRTLGLLGLHDLRGFTAQQTWSHLTSTWPKPRVRGAIPVPSRASTPEPYELTR